MTFIEALKTGRPMRRKSWWLDSLLVDRWLVLIDSEWRWSGVRSTNAANGPNRGDYLADDWEVTP